MRIGIDMGGTKIAGGLIDRGRIVKRITLPTEAGKGRAHVIRQLKAVIDQLAEGRRIEGVGIGVPGIFKGTKLIELANIPCLDGVDLKAALKLKVPLRVENDAKCFALAEARFGAAKGKRVAFGLIIGTGIGGALIIDGEIYRGSTGSAGEIGHIALPGSATWEETTSGPAILKRHRGAGGSEERVSSIWQSKSALAKRTRKETIGHIALLVKDIILMYDPDAVVLGGGVSSLPLVGEVNKELKRMGARQVLKQNRRGVDGGILGAAEALRK